MKKNFNQVENEAGVVLNAPKISGKIILKTVGKVAAVVGIGVAGFVLGAKSANRIVDDYDDDFDYDYDYEETEE